jgi:5'(3')-deoxyribonucleotidase
MWAAKELVIKNLRIGFDIDGVLANFSGRFCEIANKISGKSVDWRGQATWEFEEFTAQEVDQTWDVIHTTQDFWLKLDPLEPSAILRDVEEQHTPFFITSRVPVAGQSIERQTQKWLNWHKFLGCPTVLVVPHWSQKKALIKDLKLDSFIDDKPDTVEQLYAADVNCYIYDQPYNKQVACAPRVKSILDYIKNVEDRLGRI